MPKEKDTNLQDLKQGLNRILALHGLPSLDDKPPASDPLMRLFKLVRSWRRWCVTDPEFQEFMEIWEALYELESTGDSERAELLDHSLKAASRLAAHDRSILIEKCAKMAEEGLAAAGLADRIRGLK